MINDEYLKKEYSKKKTIIKSRLKDFSKKKNDKELFVELCFCLCTPQSNAKKVGQVINIDNFDKLMNSDLDELRILLQKNTRFHNNKSRYIIESRKHYNSLTKLGTDSVVAREFLVKNIKGLGYKEASHYLRNIGFRNICIVDRHVINLMYELKVFNNNNPPKNSKEYLILEQKCSKY